MRPLCAQMCLSCEHALTLLRGTAAVLLGHGRRLCECVQQQHHHHDDDSGESHSSLTEMRYRTLFSNAILQAVDDHFAESSVLFLRVSVPYSQHLGKSTSATGLSSSLLLHVSVVTGAGTEYRIYPQLMCTDSAASSSSLVRMFPDEGVEHFVADVSERERIPFEIRAMSAAKSDDAPTSSTASFAEFVSGRLAKAVASHRTTTLKCGGNAWRSRL